MRTKTDTGGGGGGSINGTIAANQVAFGTGADTIGGSNNFKWTNGTGVLETYFGGNGTFLVNPTTSEFSLGYYTGGGNGMALRIFDGVNFYFQADSGKRLEYVLSSQKYMFGDIDGQIHNGLITVDDSLSKFVYSVGGQNYMSMDVGGALYAFGDLGNNFGRSKIQINDTTQLISILAEGNIQMADTTGHNFFRCIPGSGITQIGDINAFFSSGLLTVNSNANTVTNSLMTWDFGATNLQNVLDPVLPQDAATKAYVDLFAVGLAWKTIVAAATAAALPAVVYANAAAGVGATLGAVLPGVLTIDGYAVQLNDRVLIKNQVAQLQNGIYTLTTVGTVGIAFILTRATDNDQASEQPFASTAVVQGTANANTAWTQVTPAPVVMGTTALVWNQFLNSVYTAGTGLLLTGNSFSLNTKLAPMNSLTGNSLKLLRVNVGETAVEYVTPSSATIAGSIANNQIAVGSAANTIGGSANFTYNTVSKIFDVTFAGKSYLNINAAAGDTYIFGNSSAPFNYLRIDAGGLTTALVMGGNSYIFLQTGSQTWGDSGSNAYMQTISSSKTINHVVGGVIGLSLQQVAGTYTLGDASGAYIRADTTLMNVILSQTVNEPSIATAAYGVTVNYTAGFGGVQCVLFTTGTGVGVVSLPTAGAAVVGDILTVQDYDALITTGSQIQVDAGSGNSIHSTIISQTKNITQKGGSMRLRCVTSGVTVDWIVE